jgi:hypothetical protein
MAAGQGEAQWNAGDWHGKMLVDCNGEKNGKLQASTLMSRTMSRSSRR